MIGRKPKQRQAPGAAYTFDKRLRRLRSERKIGSRALAQELGVSASWISKVENRLEIPSVETVIRIAEYFRVDCDDLLASAEKVHPDVIAFLVANPDARFRLRNEMEYQKNLAEQQADERKMVKMKRAA